MKRSLSMSALLLGLLGGAAQAENRPAVVELFTSQGCSSCPPADSFLGDLARRDDVIALAYHVDYWDYLGWKDAFASREGTARQRLYAASLRLSSVYTPQMVIDGATDAVGSDRRTVLAAIASPRQGPALRLSRDGNTLKISLSPDNAAPKVEVTLVAYAERAETKVKRGENAGRSLVEYNIVRGVYPLGPWSGKAQDFTADLDRIAEDATAVAVLVQSPGAGRIVSAAAMKVR